MSDWCAPLLGARLRIDTALVRDSRVGKVRQKMGKQAQTGRDNSGWIYVLDSNIEALADEERRPYKIGRARELSSRMGQLDTLYAYRTTVAYAYYVPDRYQEESNLHFLFCEYRMNGEWFSLCDADLGMIASDLALHRGYYQRLDGSFMADPLWPHSQADEEASLRLAQQYLESDKQWARKAKFYPLNAGAIHGGDFFEMEENGMPEDDSAAYEADARSDEIYFEAQEVEF